jgi:hypothetical protein
MLTMNESAVDVAHAAYKVAQASIPEYSNKYSPRTFSQWQLFAMLVVRQTLGMDYREFVEHVAAWDDLRSALGLKRVPHYSTLCVAETRFVKMGVALDGSPAGEARQLA